MGFWQCWALSVGVMVGSGVFLLPAVLAPYGSISLLGWLLTSLGTILLAVILSRLSRRTNRIGGPYAYTIEAFGELPGFLIAWGYWIGVIIGVTAISIALAGYIGSLFPVINANQWLQTAVAALCIWTFTGVNLRGVSEAAIVQLLFTLLKLLPLFAIIGLAMAEGSLDLIPEFNTSETPIHQAIAATALLTMWAFIGVEGAVIPTEDVADHQNTMSKAVVSGALTVAIIYIAASIAVMSLVPAEQLAVSTAPFIDASVKFGAWGSLLIAIGAIMATAGSLNGNIFLTGQMPLALANDKLAPSALGVRNKGRAPALALIISSILATLFLAFNLNDNLVGAFTTLIALSTLSVLTPYLFSALAELKYNWKSSKGWVILCILSVIYTLIAGMGSGIQILALGVLFFIAGLPFYYLFNNKMRVDE